MTASRRKGPGDAWSSPVSDESAPGSSSRFRGSVRRKLLISVLPALIIILVINGLYYASVRKKTLESTRQLASLFLETTAKSTEGSLEVLCRTYQEWCADDIYGMAIEFDTISDLVTEFNERLADKPGFAGLVLTDANGVVLAAVGRSGLLPDLKGKSLPLPVPEQGRKIGHAIVEDALLASFGGIKRGLLFNFASKGYEGNVIGQFVGIADLALWTSAFDASVGRMEASSLMGASLVVKDRSNGLIVANTRPSVHGDADLGSQALGSLMADAKQLGQMVQLPLPSGERFAIQQELRSGRQLLAGDTGEGELSLVALLPVATVLADTRRLLGLSALFSVLGLLVIAGVLWRITVVLKPVAELQRAALQVAEGDTDVQVPVKSNDEFGQLGDSFNSMITSLNRAILESREQENYLNASVERMLEQMKLFAEGDLSAHAEPERDDAIGTLCEGFNRVVSNTREVIVNLRRAIEELAGNSEEMASVSAGMAGNAEQTLTESDAAASAINMVYESTQSAASATTEMKASIGEISRHAQSAAEIARRAVVQASSTNELVVRLGASSQQIDKVVGVIDEIAAQTNLLALNATIEAARAGDAGKGFAVVAGEVKELAKGTAAATTEIQQLVRTIQQDARDAMSAIGLVSEIIGEINQSQSAIAAAVEEQSTTTSEIERLMSDAVGGGRTIRASISTVAVAAKSTNEGASETRRAAGDLSRMSVSLGETVSRFRLNNAA